LKLFERSDKPEMPATDLLWPLKKVEL
jgi:hypothetical protein